MARTVCEVETNLKDAFEAAVILEALGYSDRDAEAFGYRDLFGFAGAITEVAAAYGYNDPLAETGAARQRARSSFTGLFGNLAWMLLLVTLFAGGHSLWAARDLSAEVGAATGLGVVLGLAITGGLQQFASWKISYYYLQNNLPLVRFVVGRMVLMGSVLLLLTSGIAFVIGANHFPVNVAALSAVYALVVGGYRLSTAPLLGMNRFSALLGVTIFGLAGMFASYAAFTDLGVDRFTAVLSSQIVGVVLICVSSAVALGFAVGRLRGWSKPRHDILAIGTEQLRNVQPPRFWVLLLDSAPQFAFGTLFFLFLFVDRLVLWLGPNASDSRYYSGYQIGVDTALLMLMPIGVVQLPFIRRLSEKLEDVALGTRCGDVAIFARSVGAVYSQLICRMISIALAVCAVAFLFSKEIVDLAGGDSSTLPAFDAALVGVFLFSLFLTNGAFAMTFRRTAHMSVLLLVALAMNVTFSVGFVQMVGPTSAVMGFVLGSFLLALASFVQVASIIRSSDHAYYAAV